MNATWSQLREYLWAIDFKEGLVNYFAESPKHIRLADGKSPKPLKKREEKADCHGEIIDLKRRHKNWNNRRNFRTDKSSGIVSR